jgi:UDP-glucose 4-epimerase
VKVLLTGASSFTGYWFVKALHEAGHHVTATFRAPSADYSDVRKLRVEKLGSIAKCVHGVSFGTPQFLELLTAERFDVLAHHAADVTNYKSADFDAVGAVANNTKNIAATLAAFGAAGGKRVVLTGSVFENDEGAGSEGLPAFSPYGLSKSLSWQSFRYYTQVAKLGLAKFVIPNPFGPLEEPRFTAYLVKNWYAGKTPSVETPAYVRDNIHVSLMAKVYAKFVEHAPTEGITRINPSGYVESQGAFALRFAREMKSRLNLPCDVELKTQTKFTEPKVRINTDYTDAATHGWNESQAWDDLATYYRGVWGA